MSDFLARQFSTAFARQHSLRSAQVRPAEGESASSRDSRVGLEREIPNFQHYISQMREGRWQYTAPGTDGLPAQNDRFRPASSDFSLPYDNFAAAVSLVNYTEKQEPLDWLREDLQRAYRDSEMLLLQPPSQLPSDDKPGGTAGAASEWATEGQIAQFSSQGEPSQQTAPQTASGQDPSQQAEASTAVEPSASAAENDVEQGAKGKQTDGQSDEPAGQGTKEGTPTAAEKQGAAAKSAEAAPVVLQPAKVRAAQGTQAEQLAADSANSANSSPSSPKSQVVVIDERKDGVALAAKESGEAAGSQEKKSEQGQLRSSIAMNQTTNKATAGHTPPAAHGNSTVQQGRQTSLPAAVAAQVQTQKKGQESGEADKTNGDATEDPKVIRAIKAASAKTLHTSEARSGGLHKGDGEQDGKEGQYPAPLTRLASLANEEGGRSQRSRAAQAARQGIQAQDSASATEGSDTPGKPGLSYVRSAPSVTDPSDALPQTEGVLRSVAWQMAQRLQQGALGQNLRQLQFRLFDHNRAEIRLRLRPANLGQVRIHLSIEGSQLSGRIVADSNQAARILQDNLAQLESSLRDSGFANRGLDVSVGNGQTEQQGAERHSADQPAQSRTASANSGDWEELGAEHLAFQREQSQIDFSA